MSDTLTAEQYFERAVERAANRRDDQGAITDLTEAIRLKPDWAEAYFQRGVAYLNLNDLNSALADIQKVLQLDPDHAQAKGIQEVIHARPTTPQQAFQQLLSMTDAVVNDPKKATMYGFALHRQFLANPDADVEHPIDDIMKRNPVIGYMVRGAFLHARIEREKAVEAYTQAIQLDSQIAEAYRERAIIFGGFGHFQEALEDYTRTIELFEQQGQIPINIALVYSERGTLRRYTGDLDEAIADYSQAVRLCPSAAQFLVERGNLLEEKQDIEGAIADYTNAIQNAPYDHFNKRAVAFIKRGRLREDRGDLEGAVADWKEYLALGGGEQYGDRAEVEDWIKEVTTKLESCE